MVVEQELEHVMGANFVPNPEQNTSTQQPRLPPIFLAIPCGTSS